MSFRWREHMREMGYSEQAISDLGAGWIQSPIWDELDRGVMSEDDAIQLAVDALPRYEREIRGFWAHPDGLVVKYKESAEWVKKYKQAGFGIYILSNYPVALFKAHQKEFEFLPYADGVVVSSFEKVMKPDAKIFNILLERYGLKADECVFIDDREENVAGARAVGMNAVRFVSREQTDAQIAELMKG